MNFPTRNLEKIVKLICDKQKIKLNSLNEGWILKLQKGNKVKVIYGYNFPLETNSTIVKICDDKAACSDLMKTFKIDCFEHKYFMKGWYNPSQVHELFNKYSNNVVLKPNHGSSGNNVYHVTDLKDLTFKVRKVLSNNVGFCISPFYEYENEYRCIMFKNVPQIVYLKKRTNDWRHNLAVGAEISENIEPKKNKQISNLAKKISKKMDINFCSIDFAEIDNKLVVVEINSGVMMEKYSQHNYRKAYALYEKAIKEMFK